MVDPWDKSKKRSSGKSGKTSRSRQHNPVFYLDENFDCPEVKEILDRNGVRYRIYRQDAPANVGSDDTVYFPKVGRRGWLFITSDWRQRKRPREAADLQRYGVKHFVLPGNLGARGMADLIVAAKNNIKACARDHNGHVSANILRNGAVNVLRDDHGSLFERGETKTYINGKIKFSTPIGSL